MADAQEVAFFEGGTAWFYGRKQVAKLDKAMAGIISQLSLRPEGMNGAQLAKELGVTPPTVTKAAKRLIRFGILKSESLPVSQNVKLYTLSVRVLKEGDFDEIRKTASPTLVRMMTQSFGGNEKMALFYVREMQEYLRSLPESDRAKVMEKVLKEVMGREMADKS